MRYCGLRNGRHTYGCYAVCPECGVKPDHKLVPQHRIWQWVAAHILTAHKEVFVEVEGRKRTAVQ
jgi:hypothetical protein